jgi:hypothetical protein
MNVTRLILVWLSYWFDWQPALTIVGPETFTRWRRQGWRLLWQTTSKPAGRPPIPTELQALIRRMARDNLTWGQQRIANELLLKLGLRVSPRTVRKYMPRDCVGGPGQRVPAQRWGTFIRNHAQGLIANDMAEDIARRAQECWAFVRPLFARRDNPLVMRASSTVTSPDSPVVARLSNSRKTLVVIPLPRTVVIRCFERSPPERRQCRNPALITTTEALCRGRGVECAPLSMSVPDGSLSAQRRPMSTLLSTASFGRISCLERYDGTGFSCSCN